MQNVALNLGKFKIKYKLNIFYKNLKFYIMKCNNTYIFLHTFTAGRTPPI